MEIDCAYSRELAEGSPEKWRKKRLGRYLARKCLVGLLFLFPGFGYITALVFAVQKIATCARSKFKGELVDDFSAPFGMGSAEKYNLKLWFRLLYSLLVILIWSGLIGVIYFCVLSKADEYLRVYITAMLCFSGFVFCTVQIHGVAAFKCEIRKYACPKCKFANTVRRAGSSKERTRDEWRKIGTGGGEQVKTGSIYVDGTEVGATYGRTQTYGKYQQYRTTSWTDYYKCVHCGYEFNRHEKTTKAVSGVYKG